MMIDLMVMVGTFSISQPILVTDGTLGLSNNFKWQNAKGDKSFYNNLTLNLSQPLFKHNEQKTALKKVELEVEDAELSYAFTEVKYGEVYHSTIL